MVERIREVCGPLQIPYEILVVDDDSPDGTASTAKKLGVRVIIRKNKRGLASAILDGFLAADAPYVFVMDADGQHDLENFPRMINLLQSGKADLVVASRYRKDEMNAMDPLRRAISEGARLLARPVVGSLSDPMSGFFGMKKARLLEVKHWSLIGFKLLPEIIVRSPPLRIVEVPLRFRSRIAGRSKMDVKEVLDYLHLMSHLYLVRTGWR